MEGLKIDGVFKGARKIFHLISGTNVTVTATDSPDAGDNELEITISAAGAAGAPSTVDYLVGTASGDLSAEIVAGTSPGGELGGTWGSPTVDTTHSGSSHAGAVTYENLSANSDVGTGATQVSQGDHTHAGGSGHTIQDDDVAVTARTNLSFQDGFVVTDDAAGDQSEIDVSYGAAGYPLDVADTESDGTAITVARSDHVHSAAAYLKESDFTGIDFLVGTATGVTAAEIVVGTAPGGELGGTWASPTVDATHSGSTHSAAVDTHIADTTDVHDHGSLSGLADDDHTQYRLESADHTHQSAGLQGGTLDHGLALTGLTDDDHTIYRKEADPVHLVTFSKEGNLSTGTGTIRWYNDTGASITLDSARGSVGTAPATQSILIDVNNNGTSVWNATQANRITIAASTNTDQGGAFDDSTIANGEYITVDIDQVGSGTVGADLSVSIWGHYSL